jgi:DNA (cytosine-5)-methyltransferase 1
MSKLTTLEMFAGIAGFSVGLEKTGGFQTVGFIEKDDYCQRVLAKNFPGIPCHDDVTTYEFQEGEADVITAGFPCQDVSFAGAGAGLSGARSGLYREVIRAIRVVRPQYALLENVAALLNRGLDTVLGDLAEIGNDAEWHCIPASAVGAPHRRDRIWIIANPGGEQHEGCRAPLSGPLAEELSRTYPDAASERRGEAGQLRHNESEERLASICEDVADSQQGWGMPAAGSWWAVEPDVGRVAHGIPSRVDRLCGLGNAIVHQIATVIGHAILQSRGAA